MVFTPVNTLVGPGWHGSHLGSARMAGQWLSKGRGDPPVKWHVGHSSSVRTEGLLWVLWLLAEPSPQLGSSDQSPSPRPGSAPHSLAHSVVFQVHFPRGVVLKTL